MEKQETAAKSFVRKEGSMLGIIGAMEGEVAEIKKHMDHVRILKKASMAFVSGEIEGKQVVVVKSGVGKVNAAICTQILIDTFDISAIINTGVAGSLSEKIDIGDLVLSEDVVEHDMDVTGLGYEPGQIPDLPVTAFPADRQLISLAKECSAAANPGLGTWVGRIASGDVFVSDSETKQFLSRTFGALCAEMEGAAVAHTSYLNHVPFLIIRAISDKADNSAHMDYREFEKEAIRHSVGLTLEFVRRCDNLNSKEKSSII